MPNTPSRGSWKWLITCAVILALMYAGTAIHRNGPDPATLAFDTPATMGTIQALIPDNAPHPTGSAENARVADRLEATFRAAGLLVERQRVDSCTRVPPGCSRVENLVATLPGTAPSEGRSALLLMSHYDSVPGSPGAADDMAGTAVLLQTAYELAIAGTWRNDIVFLVTDGEETGLRGAAAFVNEHPLARRVGLVINLEARGGAGPSALFETSTGNQQLIASFADTVSRPVSSSLMVEVYRRMPNGTDLTLFINEGIPALNFAFTGDGARYHSAHDTPDRLSPASVAHHGDQLLGLARAWADADLATAQAGEDATYTDLFGRWVVQWPQGWNLPLAIAMVLWCGLLLVRTGARVTAILGGLVVPLSLLVLLPVTGRLLAWPLATWSGVHPIDHPHPLAGDITLMLATMLVALLAGTLFSRRVPALAALYGSWFVFAVLGLLLAILAPGGAYIGLLPVGVFLAASLVDGLLRRGRYPVTAALAGLVAAGYIAVYHYNVLDALGGFHASAVRMVALALFAMVAAPLARAPGWAPSRARLPGYSLALLLVLATLVAATRPVSDNNHPRRGNLVYDQLTDTDGRVSGTQWRLNTFGLAAADAAAAMGFDAARQPVSLRGADPRDQYVRPAPDLALPAPTLEVIASHTLGDERQVRARLRAAREGDQLLLATDDHRDLLSLSVAGVTLADAGSRGWARFNGYGNADIELNLTLPADRPVAFTLVEYSSLPDGTEADDMRAARPDDMAAEKRGDHAEIRRRVSL